MAVTLLRERLETRVRADAQLATLDYRRPNRVGRTTARVTHRQSIRQKQHEREEIDDDAEPCSHAGIVTAIDHVVIYRAAAAPLSARPLSHQSVNLLR
ncbi:MAG: hypothetical protein AVDCRST_MAG26-1842 [uncultured Chloroflexia bacterium]|uniref:Uncharacterized protein n=1 Tax=uncultured Chloroflexia bacterium TaxID=1672391 RepID=A0A6J4IDX4_9CHLR|nr:MAG: hypothetical protein AVDCRST_MAG26-1842 [uncultured Chloroflexia bacterium]